MAIQLNFRGDHSSYDADFFPMVAYEHPHNITTPYFSYFFKIFYIVCFCVLFKRNTCCNVFLNVAKAMVWFCFENWRWLPCWENLQRFVMGKEKLKKKTRIFIFRLCYQNSHDLDIMLVEWQLQFIYLYSIIILTCVVSSCSCNAILTSYRHKHVVMGMNNHWLDR